MHLPRRGPDRAPPTISFNAAPYVPPNPTDHPGLAVPLEQAGYHKTPTVCPDLSRKYSDMATRFTSFDSTHGTRILAGDRRWTHPVFVTFAVQSAQLPNAANGRIAAFEAPALPSPQVIISQVGLNPAHRAVLFDLRNLGFDIETLDAAPGATIWSSIMRLHQLPADRSVYGQLQAGRCCCLVNGVQHEVAAPLPAQADFVQLLLVARPFCQGDARPPVPPIPQSAPRTAGASASSGGGQPVGSDAQLAVRPFLTATICLSENDSRFSVLGTIGGVINRHRPPTWTDNCLLDAIVNAAAPCDFIEGHVLEYPLTSMACPAPYVQPAVYSQPALYACAAFMSSTLTYECNGEHITVFIARTIFSFFK